MKNAWQGFKTGRWTKEIDVRGFIQANYTPYEGDDSFLAGATENTKKLWDKAMDLFKKERDNGGTLDVDTKTKAETPTNVWANTKAIAFNTLNFNLNGNKIKDTSDKIYFVLDIFFIWVSYFRCPTEFVFHTFP